MLAKQQTTLFNLFIHFGSHAFCGCEPNSPSHLTNKTIKVRKEKGKEKHPAMTRKWGFAKLQSTTEQASNELLEGETKWSNDETGFFLTMFEGSYYTLMTSTFMWSNSRPLHKGEKRNNNTCWG